MKPQTIQAIAQLIQVTGPLTILAVMGVTAMLSSTVPIELKSAIGTGVLGAVSAAYQYAGKNKEEHDRVFYSEETNNVVRENFPRREYSPPAPQLREYEDLP